MFPNSVNTWWCLHMVSFSPTLHTCFESRCLCFRRTFLSISLVTLWISRLRGLLCLNLLDTSFGIHTSFSVLDGVSLWTLLPSPWQTSSVHVWSHETECDQLRLHLGRFSDDRLSFVKLSPIFFATKGCYGNHSKGDPCVSSVRHSSSPHCRGVLLRLMMEGFCHDYPPCSVDLIFGPS